MRSPDARSDHLPHPVRPTAAPPLTQHQSRRTARRLRLGAVVVAAIALLAACGPDFASAPAAPGSPEAIIREVFDPISEVEIVPIPNAEADAAGQAQHVGQSVQAMQVAAYLNALHTEALAAAAAARPRRSSGSGGCSEAQIIQRESRGDPRAVNGSSGAGGLYQILPSTWAGRGGYANAADAPVEMQQQAYVEVRASNPRAWAASGC